MSIRPQHIVRSASAPVRGWLWRCGGCAGPGGVASTRTEAFPTSMPVPIAFSPGCP